MERKIYISMILVSIIAMLITTFAISQFFYDYYLNLTEDNLVSIADLYTNTDLNNESEIQLKNNIHINIYTKDNIPIRNNKFLYHEENISKSKVLQIKTTIISKKHMILSSLSIFTGISVFIIIFLHIITAYLTKDLMTPIKIASASIENILDDKPISNKDIYPEFQPFISNINLSKKRIEYYIIKLKENEKFRREFTANISHELKTPLTSINGYAELLKYNMVKEEDLSKIGNIINSEGLRLLEIIEDIIELSNLESSELNPVFSDIDLYQIINDISNKLSLRINKKNLTLNIFANPTIIKGNYRMINDLIYNLLDNSIKYTESNGLINIKILENKKNIILIVEDSGIGIPDSQLNRIFERFYMVDKSRNKLNKSTGLGLSIVKHIIKIHDGNIIISSKLNVGTKVKVFFKK